MVFYALLYEVVVVLGKWKRIIHTMESVGTGGKFVL